MKAFCFFGFHRWEYTDGWNLECPRCGRRLTPTPAGDLIRGSWFWFWFGRGDE